LRITDEMIVPFDRRPQEFMGVEVVAREPGLAPHPHPSQDGRMVETIGVTRVLLANGHEFFECGVRVGAGTCPRHSRSARSIVAHLVSHNPATRDPDYDAATLRVVMRVAAEERQRGFRSYAVRAAERLNTMKGITRLDKKPWVSADVSRLWAAYHDRYGPQRVHVRKQVTAPSAARPTSAPPAQRTPTARNTPAPGASRPTAGTIQPTPTQHVDVEVRVTRVLGLLDAEIGKMVDMRNEVVALLAEVKRLPAPETPEIARKAKLYDDLMTHARAVASG
jgi:hypothetical protein